MQAKMESVDRPLYSADGSVRNVGAEGRFHRIVAEPLASQEAARLPAPAEALDQRSRALRLQREGGDRLRDRLRGHAVPGQVVSDPVVAVMAVRQRCRTGAGEP